tara:strand:+ start:7568 stop:9445 length:1878 start_codon:yes stop_codon:yes gene_type:complete
MCGFAGVYSPLAVVDMGVIARMGDVLTHRGPDGRGFWAESDRSVGLVHRRLAIQDVSPAGDQPMCSPCARYIIVFNGEIYNHLRLRGQLSAAGHVCDWRGHSDTETLLACISVWGIRSTLERLVGMFAFAVWDRSAKELTLARDRAGEKPLYWGWQNGSLVFGSELKALRSHPDFNAPVDRGALSVFLRHNYIPAPYTIFKGINKLPAGCMVTVSRESSSKPASPVAYWSVNQAVQHGLSDPFRGSDEEAIGSLKSILSESIEGQMLSDVPLGAFLSGGVDSSLVAAMMQERSSAPIKTFAIGFDDPRFNEAGHASAVARHLGTNHTELYVSAQDALDVVPRLPSIYCEPFADSSQIPMFLVSRMAKEKVTVALSGDGGDELFGGYNPYQFAPRYWAYMQKFPLGLRRAAGSMLGRLPLPDRLQKLSGVMGEMNREMFYRALMSHWLNPEQVVLEGDEHSTILNNSARWPNAESFEEWMMSMEAQMYMPDDILVKVDRAAMANSLETRVPLLDHRVFEFAWRLPLHMKIREGQGKWVLRQLLYTYVPKALIERPKKGFSVPMADWLRGPLREWAESLLNERRLEHEGYFNARAVQKLFKEHVSGRRNHANRLWSVLMFQAWLEQL